VLDHRGLKPNDEGAVRYTDAADGTDTGAAETGGGKRRPPFGPMRGRSALKQVKGTGGGPKEGACMVQGGRLVGEGYCPRPATGTALGVVMGGCNLIGRGQCPLRCPQERTIGQKGKTWVETHTTLTPPGRYLDTSQGKPREARRGEKTVRTQEGLLCIG
jgi:hypothetical protein